VFVRSTANASGGAAVRLGDTTIGTEWLPSWSPDGQSVRFLGCRRGAYLFALGCTWRETGKLGGVARQVVVPRGRQSSWSPDGARVAFFRGVTLFTASATDTVARRVSIRTEGSEEIHSLAWSPDGKRIAYVAGNEGWQTSINSWQTSIWVVNAEGGVPWQVVSDSFLNVSPAWLDARHLLFVSNRDGPARGVYVVEVGTAGPRGAPRAIPGVADPHSISYSPGVRRLAFARFTVRQNIWAYPLDPPAPVSIRDGRSVTRGSEVIDGHDVSPDGKWIAYSGSIRGSADLYKLPLSGGEAVPLTDTRERDEWGPIWSPDGREIAFYASVPGGTTAVFVMPSDGGTPVGLAQGPATPSAAFPRWRPDGLGVSFWNLGAPEEFRAWLASRDSVGGAWHAPVQLTDLNLAPLDWAPDGSGFVSPWGDERDRRIAVVVLVGADGRVSRRTWPAASQLRFFNAYTGLRYSRNGRTVHGLGVHQDGRRGIWAIPVAGGAPRLVVASDDPALVARFLSVGPDRLYLTVSEYESDIWVAKLRW